MKVQSRWLGSRSAPLTMLMLRLQSPPLQMKISSLPLNQKAWATFVWLIWLLIIWPQSQCITTGPQGKWVKKECFGGYGLSKLMAHMELFITCASYFACSMLYIHMQVKYITDQWIRTPFWNSLEFVRMWWWPMLMLWQVSKLLRLRRWTLIQDGWFLFLTRYGPKSSYPVNEGFPTFGSLVHKNLES